MRQFISEIKNTQNIFVGDYDSYTIITRRLSFDNLLYRTKLALLLFDHLLMPAAFFWQSSEMSRLMMYLEEPIRRGRILPVIRDPGITTDIYDYLQQRIMESQRIGNIAVFKQPELASEIANLNHIKSVRQLEGINTYAHVDGNSVRDIFISNWKTDLESHDINSIRLLLRSSQLPETEFQNILKILLDEALFPQFSRATCIERVQQIIPPGNIQNMIKDRISLLYLKSNAISYGSKFYFTYDPCNSMLFEENLILLAKTLKVFGITEQLISQLTINEILQIGSAPEFHCFIYAYRKLINATYCQQQNIVETLNKKFLVEMRKEKTVLTFRKLSFLKSTSATVFLGLIVNHFSSSTISIPVLITTGVASTIPSILKRFDFLNHRMTLQPFSEFKEYIIAEEYKNYYQKHIGEGK